jgi:NADH:ubiquinone oxidoreductase subunit 6 (subunit J)
VEDRLVIVLADLTSDAGNVLVWTIWIFAAISLLASGIAVISFANPFYSALALIMNLASLAVLYLLLEAEFVAAAQVLVYAGAVIIMFLFVIAYLGGRADAPWAGGPRLQTVGAIVAAAAIAVEVIVVIALKATDALASVEELTDLYGSPEQMGRLFLSDHLLAFEVTSIVLLVAAIGGVVLGLAGERRNGKEAPRP